MTLAAQYFVKSLRGGGRSLEKGWNAGKGTGEELRTAYPYQLNLVEKERVGKPGVIGHGVAGLLGGGGAVV